MQNKELNKIDVSIVIVSWNTREITCNCIQSIYSQTSGVNFEIIVVDNASKDDSVDVIKRQFPDVKLIVNLANRGFAAANNQGISISQGRYILLLNSDTIVLENALEKVVDYIDQHTEISVLGCKVLNADYSLQSTLFKFPSLIQLFFSTFGINRLIGNLFSFGRYSQDIYEGETDVDVVAGCFIFSKSEVFDDVGGLDESFFMYGEEADWCFRVKKKGWKVKYAPVAEIVHLIGKSSNQVRPKMALHRKAGTLHFIKKHRSWLTYRTACLFTSLWFAVRVVPWFIKGLMGSGDRANSIMIARAYLRGTFLSLCGYKALK